MRHGVDGVEVGHWTDEVARTGCTVVLLPEGTVASGEVRGGAPATREFALLDPTALVDRVDAVVLSGGSAFGLAAADGVVDWLAGAGRGFATGAGPVPIVVGMALFDLLEGDGSVRPGPAEGRAAVEAAVVAGGEVRLGRVGAGAGATVGKWRGREHARPAGLGGAVVRDGDVVVSALVAVNAFGDILGGGASGGGDTAGPSLRPSVPPEGAFGNTTLGVAVTNAALDKVGCHLVARGAHDGLARSLRPAHTRVDGDAVVVAATGTVAHPATVDLLADMAAEATETAIRSLA